MSAFSTPTVGPGNLRRPLKACCAASQLYFYNISAYEGRVAIKPGSFHLLEAVDVETDNFRIKKVLSTKVHASLASGLRRPKKVAPKD